MNEDVRSQPAWIENHETRIRDLEEDRYRRDEREKSLFGELGLIKAQLSMLVSKPAQRWEMVATDLIKLLMAAGVGYLASIVLK